MSDMFERLDLARLTQAQLAPLQALVPPRPRVATRPPRRSKLNRLSDKRHQGERKRSRGSNDW